MGDNEDTPITLSVRVAALANRLQQVHGTVYGHADQDGTWHDGIVQSAIDNKKKLDRVFMALCFLCATSVVNTLHLGSIQAIFQILTKIIGL